MDEKVELLICMGAATAVNCVPCFEYYFKRASTVGINAEEVQKVVELASKVKTGSSIVMANSIRHITGYGEEPDNSAGRSATHPCCS